MFRHLVRVLPWPLLVIVGFNWGCANLPNISKNSCGNSVVEPEAGEQCDGYAETGQLCRPRGDLGECQYACRPSDASDQTVYQCPEHSACGTDGLCRFESGKYVTWGLPVTASASSLLLGDFDGDHRDDVVTLGNPSPFWQALPKLFFFDKDGIPSEIFDPKLPIGLPKVTRLGPIDNETVAKQLLFSTSQGIASLSASEGPIVLPDAYPFQSVEAGISYRILPISGMNLNPLGDGILVFFGEAEQTSLIGAEDSTPIAVFLKPGLSFVGELLAANIDRRSSSPCAEVVFAFRNESAVYALDPCDSGGAWKTLDRNLTAIVTLPSGHSVAKNLLSSDVNGDGLLDLVLGDESGLAYVSFGLGDGRFVANPAQPETTLGQAFPLTVSEPFSTERRPLLNYPLTMGDLNADGKTDWVLPDGVLLTNALSLDAAEEFVNLTAYQGNKPFVGRWSIARVDDFNRDGLPDLVATSSTEPDLDFFMGTGKERMNRFGLSTEGLVTHLTTGDYDGDLTRDLAYSVKTKQVTSSSDKRNETVYVAFGSTTSAPTDATAIGTFNDVRQVNSAYYASTDAISELGVVSEPNRLLGEELTVFIGNAGRHPIAPLGLSVMSPEGIEFWGTPLANVAAGRFHDSHTRDAIALGINCPNDLDGQCISNVEYRLWYAAGNTNNQLSHPRLSRTLPIEGLPSYTSEKGFSAHLVAGDLDGDQLDELLILSTDETRKHTSLWPVALDSKTFSENPDSEPAPTTPLLGKSTETPGILLPTSNPTVIDLNRDNYPDLVFLISRKPDENELLVAWNDGTGQLRLTEVSSITLKGENPLGAFGRTDENGKMRLLAISEDHVYEVFPAKTGTQDLTVTPLVNAQGESLPGGKAIALGDLTGDGLLDLVVATQGKLRLYAEEPKLP